MGNEESSTSYAASDDDGGFWSGGDAEQQQQQQGSTWPWQKKEKKSSAQAALDSVSNGFTRAGQTIGVVEKPRTMEDDICEMCPKLSMKERIIGFCCCVALGYTISLCSTIVLFGGYTAKNIRMFAILYILGNLIALIATAFFVGPRRLCKRMTHKTRRIGTAIWFILMIAVFACAVAQLPLYIILILLVLETMAGIWYAASYIPYGRRMIVACCEASLFSPCPKACEPLAKQVS